MKSDRPSDDRQVAGDGRAWFLAARGPGDAEVVGLQRVAVCEINQAAPRRTGRRLARDGSTRARRNDALYRRRLITGVVDHYIEARS